MKMNSPHDETPAELKGITEVLQKSLRPGKDEEIPPMPEDLRERLEGQYGEAAASIASEPGKNVWNQLKSFFAQPAFAGSLAAFVLVGVLMSLMMRQAPKESGEVMRSGSKAVTSTRIMIILFGLEEGQIQTVKESGYFEEEHFYITASEEELADWIAREGESIVVDGAAGEIRHEDGRQAVLPESEISDAVLELLEQ